MLCKRNEPFHRDSARLSLSASWRRLTRLRSNLQPLIGSHFAAVIARAESSRRVSCFDRRVADSTQRGAYAGEASLAALTVLSAGLEANARPSPRAFIDPMLDAYDCCLWRVVCSMRRTPVAAASGVSEAARGRESARASYGRPNQVEQRCRLLPSDAGTPLRVSARLLLGLIVRAQQCVNRQTTAGCTL